MKRLLLFTLIIAIFIGSLTSCGGDDLVYHGVVKLDPQSGIVGVDIPNVGFCEIPKAKNISSELDGESRDSVVAGDLISINFGKVEDVAIMECYPARFAAEAVEITVRATEIDLTSELFGTTTIYYLTQPASATAKGANLGDLIAFLEEGDSVEDAYCYGEVYMINNGKVTLKLELLNGISEFLSKYPSAFEQRVVK